MLISEISFPEAAIVPSLWFALVLVLSLVYQFGVASGFSAGSRLISRIVLIGLLVYTGQPMIAVGNYAYGRYLLENGEVETQAGAVGQVIEQGDESLLYLRQQDRLVAFYSKPGYWQQGRCLKQFRRLHAHLNKPIEIRYTSAQAKTSEADDAAEAKRYVCILSIASKS